MSDRKAYLLDLVERKFGRKPKTPSDFNELILAVKNTTGRSLSLSTVKRLWGYVKYLSMPSEATLTTLSQYVGSRDWESFKNFPSKNDSDLIIETPDFKNIKPGATVILHWDPDKNCTMRLIGTNRFVVIDSHNIKLLPGDELTAEVFSIGQPIYMKDITRKGQNIPLYIAAKTHGLKSIKFIS